MADKYEDEEYYGEEEEYAEDGDHEYDEDEGDVAQPAKPKSNIVRTALFGVAGVLALSGIAYFAASMLIPDTLNDIVNNLPFVSHEDQAAKTDGGASSAAMPKGSRAAKGDAGASGTDVAAVPPDPAKAGAMKPKPGGATAGEEGAAPGTEGMPPAKAPKPPRMPKPGMKPMAAAAGQPNAAPMEGMPAEGLPATKPGAKPAAKPMTKPAAKPLAAAKGATAAPMAAAKGAKPASPAQMAAARKAWQKAHARKGAAVAGVSKGAFLGYGSRVVYVHGRARRVWAPMYAVVHHRKGVLPLAKHTSIAALPASWKQPPHGYVVQVGSFANSSNASQLVSQLRTQGIQAYAAPRSGKSRVFIGAFPSRQAAAVKMQQLQSQGIPAAVTAN
ncbi:MAG: Sporulation related domain [Cyanobacteria bacterium RYN_339]|nr:Sporulation related domain [Cyanobacteria bacterium RYN_339]